MEWIIVECEVTDARQCRLVHAGATNYGQSAIELEARETWDR